MGVRLVVYTRPGCIFCEQVLKLLAQADVAFQQIHVSNPEQQDKLIARYYTRTFPIVIADGHCIGSYAHILQLYSDGRLAKLYGSSPEPKTSAPPPPPESQSRRSLTGDMGRLYRALTDDPKKQSK